MTSKKKIVAIYSFVFVASVAMILFFRTLAHDVPETDGPIATELGKEEAENFFPIEEDLVMTRQDGEEVRMSDLKGKVTVLAQFFAVCPHCAVRNGAELGDIYATFKDHPDFRMVCISVDPETDGVEELAAYAEALSADPEDWWFTTAGDKQATHDYLEKELGFFKIRERRDPVDIASNGRFAHDLGFLVIDRDHNVIGKWPLPDLRSDEGKRNFPGGYERQKKEMYDRLTKELENE
ncbi:SCO family protein [Haloferula rosea]|uniref:SCO family protein n=1 Tax=Haloferula rosea TaxID=490093 RepID=A0A934R7Z7_9BACT|nr:SCO family protein [Haloferula rosea]MBK1826934.1 SCO family protein [Haloferula rosea]